MKFHFTTYILLFLTVPYLAVAQDSAAFELSYDVYKVYAPLSISRATLNTAHTVADLNRYYKPSWVREFISIEVVASHEGMQHSAKSKNDILTQEQKDLLQKADPGTEIFIQVDYIPENTLKNNDAKEYKFTFTIDPDSQATYPGGQAQLKQYLRDHIMDKVNVDIFKEHQLTAVSFTVDEEGQVVDVTVAHSSDDEKTDEILVTAVRNMPNWKPAEFANGMKTQQEFALAVGDMKSCVVNLLHIRKGPAYEEID